MPNDQSRCNGDASRRVVNRQVNYESRYYSRNIGQCQASKAELDWLVGMSHARFSLLILRLAVRLRIRCGPCERLLPYRPSSPCRPHDWRRRHEFRIVKACYILLELFSSHISTCYERITKLFEVRAGQRSTCRSPMPHRKMRFRPHIHQPQGAQSAKDEPAPASFDAPFIEQAEQSRLRFQMNFSRHSEVVVLKRLRIKFLLDDPRLPV